MRKQNKILSLGLILLSLCWGNSAYGQVQEIKKGDPSPFDGVVYSVDSHAQLVAKIQGFELKCTIEKEYLTKTLELKYNLDLSKLKIDNETLLKQIQITEKLHGDSKKLLLNQIEEQQKIPWYKSSQFNFWLGFGIATVMYGIISWGILNYGSVSK